MLILPECQVYSSSASNQKTVHMLGVLQQPCLHCLRSAASLMSILSHTPCPTALRTLLFLPCRNYTQEHYGKFPPKKKEVKLDLSCLEIFVQMTSARDSQGQHSLKSHSSPLPPTPSLPNLFHTHIYFEKWETYRKVFRIV